VSNEFHVLVPSAPLTYLNVLMSMAWHYRFPKMGQLRKSFVHTVHCSIHCEEFWKNLSVDPAPQTFQQEVFNFAEWDHTLRDNSFLCGNCPSRTDVEVHAAIARPLSFMLSGGPSLAHRFVHLERWRRTLCAWPDTEIQSLVENTTHGCDVSLVLPKMVDVPIIRSLCTSDVLLHAPEI